MKTKNKFKYIALSLVVMFLITISFFAFFNFKTTAKSISLNDFANSYLKLTKNDNLKNAYINFNNMTDDYVDVNSFCSKTGATLNVLNSTYEISINNNSVKLQESSDYAVVNNSSVEYLQTKIKKQNGSILIPCEKISKMLGYNVLQNENSLTLYKPFYLKRLLIKANANLKSMGEIASSKTFNGLVCYQYETEEQTKKAFDYYKNCDSVFFVEADTVVSCYNNEECAKLQNKNLNAIKSSKTFSTWGAEVMGVDPYLNYLQTSIGKDNLKPVTVAVIDTGLDNTHPWFAGRIAEGGANFIYSDSPSNYVDDHGHGTHVAGTICDLTYNNVKILPIKVLDNFGYGTSTSIYLGMEEVIKLKTLKPELNIVAMNLSLGGAVPIGSNEHTRYVQLCNDALNKNILTVVAAGNESQNAELVAPANVQNAITVSSIEKTNNGFVFSDFSNYGNFVDITAPGTNILSAKMGGGTTYLSGTSMASPHVAAAVALIYSNSNQVYSATQVEKILKNNAVDLGAMGYDIYFGEGIVNIESAYCKQIENVTFSNQQTNLTESFNLKLSSSEPNSKIYYTLNGTEPNNINGTLYSGNILISKTTLVRAKAYLFDENNSVIATSKVFNKTYILNNEDIQNAYEIDLNGTITKYKGVLQNVKIPLTINGKTPVKIGKNAFLSNANIESVEIPQSVLEIEENAFESCLNLKIVTANGVTKIKNFAFKNCTSLMELNNTMFKSLQQIGKGAFYNCKNIQTINLSNVLKVCEIAFVVESSKMGEITNEPNSKLSSVVLPNCEICEDGAFLNNNKLLTINMPKLKVVGAESFLACGFKTLNLQNLENCGAMAFKNNRITEVVLPKCKILGFGSFFGNDMITSLQIENVEQIGAMSFYNCFKLKSLNLPKVKTIFENAFAYCNIENLDMPNVEIISNFAFADNKNLKTINVPGCKNIYSNAFKGCSNLTTINLSSVINYISLSAFEETLNNATFNAYFGLPSTNQLINLGYNVNYLDDYKNFNYIVKNNEIEILGLKTNVQKITIPAYIENLPVTRIANSAFKNNEFVEFLNLPNVKEIGLEAFYGCENLVEVKAPNVKKIGANAFYGCANLKNAEILNVKNVGNFAFKGCDSLKTISLLNVETLGTECFAYTLTGKKILDFKITSYLNGIANKYATDNSINFEPISAQLKNFYYAIQENSITHDKTALVYSVLKHASGRLFVPSDVNGIPIVGIFDEAFLGCSLITEIILPSSIKSVGQKSFAMCENLQSINLENINILGDECFEGCYSLQNVNCLNLQNMGAGCFKNCIMLKNVNIPKVQNLSIANFQNCELLESVSCSNLQNVGVNVFNNTPNLKTIDLFNVKMLGSYNGTEYESGNFNNSIHLTNVNLQNIVVIGKNSFSSNLQTIAIGKNFDEHQFKCFSEKATIYGYADSSAYRYSLKFSNPFNEICDVKITTNLPSKKLVEQNSKLRLSVQAVGYELVYNWYLQDGGIFKLQKSGNENTLNINTNFLGLKKYKVEICDWLNNKVTSSICSVTVAENLIYYNISVQKQGEGNIEASENNKVLQGENFVVKFSPQVGYFVKEIKVNGVTITSKEFENAVINGYEFNNVNADYSILIIFEIKKFKISFVNSDYVQFSKPFEMVNYGDSLIVEVVCKKHYAPKLFVVDGRLFPAEGKKSFTFNNVVADHVFEVVADREIYCVKFNIGNSKLISGEVEQYVEYSLNATAPIIQKDGYTFVMWNKSFNNVSENLIIEPVWEIIEYKITYIPNNSANNVIEFDIETPTFNLKNGTKEGNMFLGWYDNAEFSGNKIESINKGTYKNLTLYAKFEPKKLDIKVTHSSEIFGTILINNENLKNANYGDYIEIWVTPKEGYAVDKVVINGKEYKANNNKVVIQKLSENLNINVTYKNKMHNPKNSNINYMLYGFIGGAVAVLLIAVVAFIVWYRKNKN